MRARFLDVRRPPGLIGSACSFPDRLDRTTEGRVEVIIGPLGSGKTTWAAIRARRLGWFFHRELVTTGIGWPEPWRCVASWEELEALHDAVLVVDEAHSVFPGTQKVQSSEVMQRGIDLVAYFRKNSIEVICPTQSWTKVATHLRDIVTTVWVTKKLAAFSHMAFPYDSEDDGGASQGHPIAFDPRNARIPTKAAAWRPGMSHGSTNTSGLELVETAQRRGGAPERGTRLSQGVAPRSELVRRRVANPDAGSLVRSLDPGNDEYLSH